MKAKFLRRKSRGWTLTEMMLVTVIIGILFSILSPHFDLLLQKAYQSTTKGNLGMLRTTISIYYADNEGKYPLANYPDGPADMYGVSISETLIPRYTEKILAPKLKERVSTFNGFTMIYDDFVGACLAAVPPKDVYLYAGPVGSTAGFDRPWMYDPASGFIYICNNNIDRAGVNFYVW